MIVICEQCCSFPFDDIFLSKFYRAIGSILGNFRWFWWEAIIQELCCWTHCCGLVKSCIWRYNGNKHEFFLQKVCQDIEFVKIRLKGWRQSSCCRWNGTYWYSERTIRERSGRELFFSKWSFNFSSLCYKECSCWNH